jgi:predicted phage-related endonuclease
MDRKTYIGGSDAAAVLGLSDWSTPLDVYYRKRGEDKTDTKPDPMREKRLRRGKLMEPVVVQMLQDEAPITITRRSTDDAPNRLVDQDCDFLAAEIDFEWTVTPGMRAYLAKEWDIDVPEDLIGSTQNGEVKTVHPFAASIFGQSGTDEIPLDYAAQAMHGLMITGRALTLFPVLVGSDSLLLYMVKRDEDTIKGMRDRLVRFWLDNVLAGVPPEPLILRDVYRLMKRDAPRKIEATPQVAALLQAYRVTKQRIQTFESAAEALQFEIGCYMLGAEAMDEASPKDAGKYLLTVGGAPALTVSLEKQSRIDLDVVKEKHPDVAKECAKSITFRKFTLKKEKP